MGVPLRKTGGSIIGRVFNEDRSKGVENALVEISTLSRTSLTDGNGWYTLTEIPSGQYKITITKENYASYSGQIYVQSSNSTLYDVVLYPALAIRDASGKVVSELTFGEYVSSLSFTICNLNGEAIRCTTQTNVSWINVSEIQTTVPAGGSQEIIVSIDRSKLNGGSNTGVLSIASASFKKDIDIIAIGETIRPIVQTLPMSAQYGSQDSGWVDTFNGRVVNEGKPPYEKKGFCFSSTNREPTVADIIVGVSGNDGTGEFSHYALEYFANHTYRETYYARAWVLSGENQYEYGNVIQFVFNPTNLTF